MSVSTKAATEEHYESMAALAGQARLVADLISAKNRIAADELKIQRLEESLATALDAAVALKEENESLRQSVQRAWNIVHTTQDSRDFQVSKARNGRVWDL